VLTLEISHISGNEGKDLRLYDCAT